MSMDGLSEFPSLEMRAEKSRKIEELWMGYIEDLRLFRTFDIRYDIYANKLQECWEIRQDLSKINIETCSIEEFLENWSKIHNVEYDFLKRMKDFIGLNEKIRLYLNKGRTVDQIMDFVGFRIILKTNLPEEENIALCYELMNDLIMFMVLDKKYIPMRAEPLSDLGVYPKEIIVPKQTMLYEAFIKWVKDYVRYPKGNGYQSLHVVLKNPFTNQLFEIQIRTKNMDSWAEFGLAQHQNHKRRRYLGYQISLDPAKLKIEGFEYENGEIKEDTIGLMKSKYL